MLHVIKQIFTNNTSKRTFCLSEDSKVYGSGPYSRRIDHRWETVGMDHPILIKDLSNIISIQSNEYGSIALWKIDTFAVIDHMYRHKSYEQSLPN